MGIGCEKNGAIYVADKDVIETSNLNRHFLFRTENISVHQQQMKATTAAKMISSRNPSMNIHAFVDRVDSNTERIFDDKFFDQLDGVIDASDNIRTREYFSTTIN